MFFLFRDLWKSGRLQEVVTYERAPYMEIRLYRICFGVMPHKSVFENTIPGALTIYCQNWPARPVYP